jgi:hypothetical protein
MLDLPSLPEAFAAWVAGSIARAWWRSDPPEGDEESDELDDD